MSHVTKAIVLKRTKLKEADLIVEVLDERGAKLSLLAKGALKSKKRFIGGLLEPLNYIQVWFTSKPHSDLHFVNEVVLIESFDHLRESLERLQLGFYFIAHIRSVVREGTIDSYQLFTLLGNALRAAEQVTNLSLLKLHFEIKLLYVLGVYRPSKLEVTFFNTTMINSDHIDISPEAMQGLTIKIGNELANLN